MRVALVGLHRVRRPSFPGGDGVQAAAGIGTAIYKFSGLIAPCPTGKAFGVSKARWPVKSAEFLLGLLRNAEANADTKGLDTGNLIVKHIQVNQAPKQRRRTYRAHGRVCPHSESLVGDKIMLIKSTTDQPVHVEPLPHRIDSHRGRRSRAEV